MLADRMLLFDYPERTPAESLFDELTIALAEMPGVALGRRYGRWCLKFQRQPFIALDQHQIAFRVGLEATALLEYFPPARLWNPRNERMPKQSWIAHPACDPERIATLSAMAYKCAVSAASLASLASTESVE
jgi:hypothetical protein